MKQQKYLFIDRDGTLIVEPPDEQIDSIDKLEFMPGVFTALQRLQQAGYHLVMVSNQDGLGTASFPTVDFSKPHELMLKILRSQGIEFADIRICPHTPQGQCECRKPKVGLLWDYCIQQTINLNASYVIGDRESDVALANNLGLPGIQIGSKAAPNWQAVARMILEKPRRSTVQRTTKETNIHISVDLDQEGNTQVQTGIGFFDHMLEQVAKHAGMSAVITVQGDLQIDDHHAIEDTAIALGTAIRQALGDKYGITRYGFLLPMDEARAMIALDLSGRSYCQFNCDFTREQVGGLATEMIGHFFRSLADGLQATLQIEAQGDNTHHTIEAIFKGVGRVLKQAMVSDSISVPSTKGVL